jgi:hypothetical protein
MIILCWTILQFWIKMNCAIISSGHDITLTRFPYALHSSGLRVLFLIRNRTLRQEPFQRGALNAQ